MKTQSVLTKPFPKDKSNIKNMKIFEIVQKHYAILGIGPSTQQLAQKYPFSERVILGFLLFGCGAILQFVYIFHVASGPMEYMECVCFLSGIIIMFVCFAAIVFRKTMLFTSIDNIKSLIDTSEAFRLNCFYF